MQKRLLLNSTHFDITIKRLCYQLIENHDNFSNSALIGLQPRGIYVARRIEQSLKQILNISSISIGDLDVTFYRDDFRRREIIAPNQTRLDFIIEDKFGCTIQYTGFENCGCNSFGGNFIKDTLKLLR